MAEGIVNLVSSDLQRITHLPASAVLQDCQPELVALVRVEPLAGPDPNALYSPTRWAGPEHPSLLRDELVFQTKALMAASASIDVMLDTRQLERGPDTGWTAESQRFSDWLDELDQDSQQKRKAIDSYLLQDLQQESAEEAAAAKVPAELFQEWGLKGWVRAIAGSPAVGLFRAMLHSRHLNRGTTWRPNDLTDMVYLSCAAGTQTSSSARSICATRSSTA
ncbi:hypothetical protein ACFVYD_20015 [Streptomyces sp. NPDC058301]|uniref:hypothetical protein n=1 Tax=Streptomyces sp. NPDC058301 TaxID=3346436 RepID=UPI0036E7D430